MKDKYVNPEKLIFNHPNAQISPAEWWKVCAFYHTSMTFCTKMHLDALFNIWVRGKLNYFNMVVKSKMAENEHFEGICALVMRACISHWSLNNAYYATEVKIKDE